MRYGNDQFEIVNNWLGWGDPDNGLWFIGMEEGATLTAEDVTLRGKKTYDFVSDNIDLNWKVANTTAKVVSRLIQHPNYQSYRDSIMWRKGSKVFNGNLLPLGKPKRTAWPKEYYELFGFRYEDYSVYFKSVQEHRYQKFKDFKSEKKPQAIVCFGKEFWSEFEHLFVDNIEDRIKYNDGLVVYEKDKVILTGHFSYVNSGDTILN